MEQNRIGVVGHEYGELKGPRLCNMTLHTLLSIVK